MSLGLATVFGAGDASSAARIPSATQVAPRAAAVLTVISGIVQLRSAGGDFANASDGEVLYVGSSVRTGADARAVITLFEGSTVELEPASDITIEEATTSSGSTIVDLAQSFGRSWHVVTHLVTADSRYQVKTPSATASVRGTSFEVVVEDGATTVTTTEGRVATSDAAATTEVLVTPDRTTTVRANGVPEEPRAAPAAQRVVSVVAVSESSIVVDPLGRANGLKDGKVLAQTPGATVRKENGTIVVTLPNVPDGIFTTSVAHDDDPVAVTTTVADKDEEPVSATSVTGTTATGVELRTGAGRPEVRTLSADETRQWMETKPNKSETRPTVQPAPRGAVTPEPTVPVPQLQQTDPPAPTPRRTPTPAATRR